MLESICNPRLDLGNWLWQALEPFDPANGNDGRQHGQEDDEYFLPSMQYRSLAQVINCIKHPETNGPDIAQSYLLFKQDEVKLRRIVGQATRSSEKNPKQGSLKRVMRDYSAIYAVLITFMMILNGIQQATQPTSQSFLSSDATDLVDTSLALAKVTSQYRPLGGEHIPFCLILAWLLAKEAGEKRQMEEVAALLSEWQSDFKQTRWMDLATWWAGRFKALRHRRQKWVRAGEGVIPLESVESAELTGPVRYDGGVQGVCCVQ